MPPSAPSSLFNMGEGQYAAYIRAMNLRNGTNLSITNPNAREYSGAISGVTANTSNQAARPNVGLGNVENEINAIKGITPQASAQLLKNIEQQAIQYEKLGQVIETVKIKKDALNASTIEITTSFKSANGSSVSYKQQLENLNTVLTKTQIEERKLKLEQEQRIAALKAELGPQRYAALEEQFTKHGYTAQNIKTMSTQQPSGVTSVQFTKIGESGVPNNMELTVDRMGGVLNRTRRQLLGFTDSVIRNTGELLKWSIGIGIVYGSYYKLQQLFQLAIDNQTKLVDVTVTLGDSQRTVNDIFNDAAAIAQKTGENLNGVLESYTMVYRAVGAVQDPIDRTTAANKLLYDTTVLNKLSNLDAASSIDVLSGALRQIALPGEAAADSFARGTKLLDSWVAITKHANVDMATLATAFSVTAESALNSGMSIDQLNAVITTLSEKIGGLGGKETGNAVRALIGGVYQQQAVDILQRYGIAVTDSEGKMRDFLKISQDIYDLYRAGIIDTTELNKIGYTLGGGVRRGQQYVAFLTDMERVNQVAAISAAANGDAQAALERKLATVQTSSTRLSNSFQGLAQAMGDRGGLLESATNFNTILGSIVLGLTQVVQLVGPATTSLIALGAVMAYTGIGGISARNRINYPFMMAGGSLQDRGMAMSQTSNLAGQITNVGGIRGALGNAMSGAGRLVSNNGLAMTLGAIPAIGNLTAGRGGQAVADVVGAILGGLATGGSPVGVVIGSAAAEALYSTIVDKKSQFSDFFSEIWSTTKEKTPTDTTQADKEKAAMDAAFALMGKGQLGGAGGAKLASNAYSSLVTAGAPLINLFGQNFEGVKPVQFAQMWSERKFGADSKEAQQLAKLIEDARKGAEYTTLPEAETQYYTKEKAIGDAFKNVFSKSTELQRSKTLEQRRNLEITSKQADEAIKRAMGTGATIGGIYQTMGGTPVTSPENVKKIAELTKSYNAATQEDQTLLAQLVSQYKDLSVSYESAMKAGSDEADAIKEKMVAVQEEVGVTIEVMDKARLKAEQAKFTIPGTIQTKGITGAQMKDVDKLAHEIQQREVEFFRSQNIPGFDEQNINEMMATAEPLFVDMGDQMGFYISQGLLDQDYFSQALQKMAEEGIGNLGYQFMDVTQAQFDQAMKGYAPLKSSITGAGGTVEETPLLTFFSDSTNPMLMTKDWKLVQYLLQEILKVNEKQLDGMYNLPSGSSFYVPFQAWEMDTETRKAGAAGATDVNITGLDQPTTKFSSAVDMFGNSVTAMVDIFGRALTGPASEANPYVDKYGRPKIGPNSERVVPSDYNKTIPTPLTPYVDEYGRPLPTGPRGATGYTTTPFAGPRRDAFKPDESDWNNIIEDWFKKFFSFSIEKNTGGANPLGTVEKNPNWLTELQDKAWKIFAPFFEPQAEPGWEKTPIGAPPDWQQGSVPPAATPINTAFNLTLSTQTQLIVDGRVLADIIKPYLTGDMLSSDASMGSTASYTVA